MADKTKDDHPDNQKAVHEGWKDIKDKKRGCTDCLFLVSEAAFPRTKPK